MMFRDTLAEVIDWLQQDKRVSYRALKRQFDFDDAYLDDLKLEIIKVQQLAVDQDGEMLVWTGDPDTSEANGQREAGLESRFHALLPEVIVFLQRDRRVTYRTLKYIFSIDEALLAEIRKELRLRRLAVDDEDEVLVWTGEALTSPQPVVAVINPPDMAAAAIALSPVSPAPQPHVTAMDVQTDGAPGPPEESPAEVSADGQLTAPKPVRSAPEAERRQLTVMFCDLVGSTDLSGRLDPEDLRQVVRAYQETAAEVIERYHGHIAQYLGDGLLIYFGYPVAHEDDAQRAVHTGLGIIEALGTLNARLEADYGVALAVRIGIHTGPVVVGEMGSGGRHENLALGETPNIAARLEGLAQSNAVVISSVTAQLVQRSFVVEELGPHALKGLSEPMPLYAVVSPHEVAHDDHETMPSGGFDVLVGRDEEIGLLLRRWEQSKEGLGHVVLLSGEAGIGKSSLVDGLRKHVHQERFTRIAFRCSPYHMNSAFYSIIEHIQRALGWQLDDTVDTKLSKLEQVLGLASLVQEEAVPLLAGMLSLPLPEARYPALTLSPQEQRQKTQDVLVAWLLEEADRQPVLAVWEDLHWADPSTLEALGLLVDQVPTVAMLNVLTFRPEFQPPWPLRSHLTPMTLNRLERPQVEVLLSHLTKGKVLPAEVVQHILTKTDGIPLYIEELTKMLLASDLLREDASAYVLTGPLTSVAIPDTLQDLLMARLDQLKTAKEVAQLGAVLGREFSYEMLQAIASQDEETVRNSLSQLVQAELLYQRGRPPRARYIFKHALIQDAAYASLLRSTRQQLHQQVVQVLEQHALETVHTQPELVAYHCTASGRAAQAVPYWHQAGQRALERSAYAEASAHLTTGLELLQGLPDTLDQNRQEMAMQIALGQVWMDTKGMGAPEVGRAYSRAYDLCRQTGETRQLVPVLVGLSTFHQVRGEMQKAQELAEAGLQLALEQHDTHMLLQTEIMLGMVLFFQGEFAPAHHHLEQGMARYQPEPYRASVVDRNRLVQGPIFAAQSLWYLGYPDQALRRSGDAVALGQELTHPRSLSYAFGWAAVLHQLRREPQAIRAQIETARPLATEHRFAQALAWQTLWEGWALAAQGRGKAGLEQIRQGLEAWQATGSQPLPQMLALLAEAYGHTGQTEAGLDVLAETLTRVDITGQRYYEAELHRLQGELIRHAGFRVQGVDWTPEGCFQKALDVAQSQQAKSLELRAVTSLARLWQSQGKRQKAYDLLAPVYEWFTEGFDTADLIEAKHLLDELSK